jgi:hypothetical protein
MSQLIKPFIIDFPELFTSLDREGFARLGDESAEGIRINADEIEYTDGEFSCRLLIEYTFSLKFVSCFQRIQKAIAVSVENASSGQCEVFSLIDPHKVYPPSESPNFNPSYALDEAGHVTAYREIPLSMKLGHPGWGPHLFMRAQIQGFISNILAFDFSDEFTLSSYLDGKPYTMTLSDADDE